MATRLATLAGLAAARAHGWRRCHLVGTTPAAALAATLAALTASAHRQRRQRVTAARLGRHFDFRITRLHAGGRDRRCVLVLGRGGSAHLVMILV